MINDEILKLNEKFNDPLIDQDKLMTLTIEKAKSGDLESIEIIALVQIKSGKEKDGLRNIEGLAQKGRHISTHMAGWIYYTGHGIPKDHEKAFKYFSAGAGLGIPDSKGFLGVMYSAGFYVMKDPVKAGELLLESAKGGFNEAFKWIGLRYHNGVDGLDKNPLLAQAWLKKAAELNDPRAVKEVGDFNRNIRKLSNKDQEKLLSQVRHYENTIQDISAFNDLPDDKSFTLSDYMPSTGLGRLFGIGAAFLTVALTF